MKLPFERIGNFIVWYIKPDFPIVIPANELSSFINESADLEPLQSMELKMAVFQGVGSSADVNKAAQIFGKELGARINNKEWPYSYRFVGSEASAAFEAYVSTFCYCNKRIVANQFRTSIDGHVSYEFEKKGIFGCKKMLSFSRSMIASVIGPSGEFFVGLSNSDYLYFGGGDIKRLYFENTEELPEEPDYHDLMAWSYCQR
jgi:hypothetical protein